jgi:hypothetical protein
MAKRKSKKKSYWSPTAVVGRVPWGRAGFKGAVRRVRREWIGPRTVASIRPDPDTGKLKAAGVRQRKDGTWEAKPPRRRPTKAKPRTAKQRIADMQSRIATESDKHAKYLATQNHASAKPKTVRAANGTYNGSVKATPEQRAQAQADVAYRKAAAAAAKAERHANQLLRRGL